MLEKRLIASQAPSPVVSEPDAILTASGVTGLSSEEAHKPSQGVVFGGGGAGDGGNTPRVCYTLYGNLGFAATDQRIIWRNREVLPLLCVLVRHNQHAILTVDRVRPSAWIECNTS